MSHWDSALQIQLNFASFFHTNEWNFLESKIKTLSKFTENREETVLGF